MAHSAPEIVYGATLVAQLSTDEYQYTFNILKKHKIKTLDTANIYPGSEATLGQNDTPKTFSIHTKAPGLQPGSLAKQSVLDGMEKSLRELGVNSVDIYYLHNPDAATPIEETLSAIQELYAAGKFKRFGLSNFLPHDVEKIYNIQAAAHSVLPTAFQGNYNAIARHAETDLFPLLHRLNISFYAYSPIAGGFFAKDPASLRSRDVEGRFGGKTFLGDMYNVLYGKESMYAALDEWGRIAKDAGISRAALAYRWVVWHGALRGENGDGVVVGAKTDQLEETLEAIEEGPLEERVAERASGVWEKVKADAPRDNWNDYLALKG